MLVVDAEIEEILPRLRVLEIVLIVRAYRLPAARRADAEAAEVRDLPQVNIGIAVSEVGRIACLWEQRAVDERRLLDIVPVAGRCDEGDTEVVRTPRQIAVRIGSAHTPVTGVVVTGIVDIDRDMRRLVLLHRHGEVIAPILLAHEICRQLRGIRVVDELQFPRELRHIDLALTQHRHHAADHALAPLLVARDRHAGDIHDCRRRGMPGGRQQ